MWVYNGTDHLTFEACFLPLDVEDCLVLRGEDAHVQLDADVHLRRPQPGTLKLNHKR